MTQILRMYTDDVKPDLKIQVTSDDDFDLTEATSIRVIGKQNGNIILDRAPSVVAPSIVTVFWNTGDTVTSGPIYVEVEIIWPGDKKQTVRVGGYIDLVEDFA